MMLREGGKGSRLLRARTVMMMMMTDDDDAADHGDGANVCSVCCRTHCWGLGFRVSRERLLMNSRGKRCKVHVRSIPQDLMPHGIKLRLRAHHCGPLPWLCARQHARVSLASVVRSQRQDSVTVRAIQAQLFGIALWGEKCRWDPRDIPILEGTASRSLRVRRSHLAWDVWTSLHGQASQGLPECPPKMNLE